MTIARIYPVPGEIRKQAPWERTNAEDPGD